MRHQERNPVEHGEDGNQANKVTKDCGGRFRGIHVSKENEDCRGADSVNGVTILTRFGEDSRRLSVFGESVE